MCACLSICVCVCMCVCSQRCVCRNALHCTCICASCSTKTLSQRSTSSQLWLRYDSPSYRFVTCADKLCQPLRRLPWADKEFFFYGVKCFVRYDRILHRGHLNIASCALTCLCCSAWKIKFYSVPALASLLAGLKKYQEPLAQAVRLPRACMHACMIYRHFLIVVPGCRRSA